MAYKCACVAVVACGILGCVGAGRDGSYGGLVLSFVYIVLGVVCLLKAKE